MAEKKTIESKKAIDAKDKPKAKGLKAVPIAGVKDIWVPGWAKMLLALAAVIGSCVGLSVYALNADQAGLAEEAASWKCYIEPSVAKRSELEEWTTRCITDKTFNYLSLLKHDLRKDDVLVSIKPATKDDVAEYSLPKEASNYYLADVDVSYKFKWLGLKLKFVRQQFKAIADVSYYFEKEEKNRMLRPQDAAETQTP